MAELVITAAGPDRPGIVGDITGHLLSAGGNIADSRMINLRGTFVLVLLVDVPDDKSAALQEALTAAGKNMGLTVTSVPAGAAGRHGPTVQGMPYQLRTYSLDQPGIVHRVTHILNRHGINIEELQTKLESSSFSGTPLFTMDVRMTIPPGVKLTALRAELETMCDTLNCDMDLDPV